MNYFLFFFICYSVAFTITEQKVFEELRSRLKECDSNNPHFIRKKLCQLIHCPSCVGFWAGLMITIMGLNIFNIGYFDPFFGGLAASLMSYFMHLSKNLLEKMIKVRWDVEL